MKGTMLVRLSKRRGEYPSGSIVDLPLEEAEALIGFGLAQAVGDVDAEVPRSLVERAKLPKVGRTATVTQTEPSVAPEGE
jgi:hypothetical protein